MVMHGASPSILFEAHPHITFNKLPKLIQEIRNSILKYGGEIHFNTKVIDFILEGKEMKGVVAIQTTEQAAAPADTANIFLWCCCVIGNRSLRT